MLFRSWNLFLGGTSSIRLFGDAVLDGWVFSRNVVPCKTLNLEAAEWISISREARPPAMQRLLTAFVPTLLGPASSEFYSGLRLCHAVLTSPICPRYYVTAAPQCVYPDASLGGVLNAASFDAIYVQFCESPEPEQ